MQHSFRDFLRHGGHGEFLVTRNVGLANGPRPTISFKALIPNHTDLRAAFARQLDAVIAENTRMLLNALTPPDTVPTVTAADLLEVSDVRQSMLNEWDARLVPIHSEYQTLPQRIRPLRENMEERLLRAFAGLINQLRQEDLGIERYFWRSRDDAKVRASHAAHDDQVFRWDDPPESGHPGQAFNCRCIAEPFMPRTMQDIVLADFAPTADSFPDTGSGIRRLAGGLIARSPAGLLAYTVLEASSLLQDFVQSANDQRVLDAAAVMGADLTTVEGLLAARAYALALQLAEDGFLSDVPERGDRARIIAEVMGLYEMYRPGLFTLPSENALASVDFARSLAAEALAAFETGRLTLNDDTIAQGWVEVFPALTDDGRHLGELPGFTPERIEGWLETYHADILGLPNSTGAPQVGDLPGSIIFTPIPDASGPQFVEARGDGNFTTPGGNIVRDHGGRGNGLDYITGKGHTPAQIDDIIANHRPDLSGIVAGRGQFRGQEMVLLTGQDGHWVVLSPQGDVIAVSNRNIPLREEENESDPIIRPLE